MIWFLLKITNRSFAKFKLFISIVSTVCLFSTGLGYTKWYSYNWYKRCYAGLTKIPDDITDIHFFVSLSGNNITHLVKADLSRLSAVETLHLDRNRISEIKYRNFPSLTKLYYLHLTENNMKMISKGAFATLTNLKHLCLGKNKLETLHQDQWRGLNSLMKLQLSYNTIKTIPNSCFHHLVQLKTLQLNGNGLTAMKKEMWLGLTSLELLDLGRNKITTIEPEAFEFSQYLRQLHLNGNRLTTFRTNAFGENFQGLFHRQTFYLGLYSNPLHCNLEMAWLKEAATIRMYHPSFLCCTNFPGMAWDEITLMQLKLGENTFLID